MTLESVLVGLTISSIFKGETYVSIIFDDETHLTIQVDGFDDGLSATYEEIEYQS